MNITADIIERDIKVLVSDWIACVRDKVPASRDLSDEFIKNHLEEFLKNLISALRDEDFGKKKTLDLEISALHDIQRSGIGQYSIGDLILEYHLLRSIIFNHIENLSLDRRDRNLINDFIDESVRKVASEFESNKKDGLLFITRSIPGFVSYVDKNERYLFVNEAYAKWFGLKDSEILGKTLKELLGENYSKSKPHISKVLSGEFTQFELPLKSQDGNIIHLEVNYIPDFDENKNVRGFAVVGHNVTEQKLNQISIQNQLKWLQSILDIIPASVILADTKTNEVMFANKAAQNSTGGIKKDINGYTRPDYWLEDSEGKKIEPVNYPRLRAIRGEKMRGEEFTWHTPNGSWDWIMYSDLLPERYGMPETAMLSFLDISELKAKAAELESREQDFRNLANSIPQLAWMANPDGSIYWYNQRWLEYTGTTLDEMLSSGWQKFQDPEYLPKVVDEWKNSLTNGENFEMEFPLKAADGTFKWFLTIARPMLNSEGKVYRWFGTNTDIEAARKAKIEFERNVDVSPAILWITEVDGLCSYLSKQWYEMTGQTPETGLGFGWLSATHPDDKAQAGKCFNDANTNKTFFRTEYRLRDKNGNYRWCIDAGNPRFDKQGNYLGMAGTVLDVNERYLALQQVEEAKNQAITLANKLQEAVKARDEFLSIASHELKTPLTSLKLQTQSAIKKIIKAVPLSPDKMMAIFQKNETQVNRLVRLVDDMLDLTRLQSGKLSYNTETCDLCEIIMEVYERIKDQFEDSDVKLTNNCNIRALGSFDKARVEQVIINLLTNALKYGKGRPVEMRLNLHETYARLEVQDHGIGISSDNYDKIFKRYERIVSANEISGLGIGLYITKQIVEAHGGKIWVESKINQGSTFYVDFPLGTNK